MAKEMFLADLTRDWIIRHCVAVEAGYVNNPKDPGKETKHGITATTAAEHKAELVRRFGWSGKMIDLTEEMAMWIYRTAWWDRMRCDELHAIHPFIADRVFDFAVNAGRALGVKTMQRILNVSNREGKDYADIDADGGVGKLTIAALESFYKKRGVDGLETFVQFQLALQGAHYVTLAEQKPVLEEFVNGWGARVRDINKLYQRVLLNEEKK